MIRQAELSDGGGGGGGGEGQWHKMCRFLLTF